MDENRLKMIQEQIKAADDRELDEITKSVILRFTELNPEWEAVFFTLPRSGGIQREREINHMMEYLRKWTFDGPTKKDLQNNR